MTAAAATVDGRARRQPARLLRTHGWTVAVYVLLAALVAYWRTVPEQFSAFDVQSLVIGALPLAFAAMAQAVVVISGGIDLSVGSLMSVVNVLSAKHWVDTVNGAPQPVSVREALLIGALLVLGGVAAGALTGTVIVVSGVPDIVVTLATLFFWAGLALWIMPIPGGGAPVEFINLVNETVLSQWIPKLLVLLLVVFAVVWLPLRWSRPGLALYAVGSNRNAAYLSGIPVGPTRVLAYALGGGFAALGGLALTVTTTIGSPLSGEYYTLNSVAAVVLGGVALVGGRGGLIGPIAAAFILTLATTVLVLRGVDPNYGQVIQGALIVGVVMLGALATRRRG